MLVTTAATRAAETAALTPATLARLTKLAHRATARYRAAGIEARDILGDVLAEAAATGTLLVILASDEAEALRRLENTARDAAKGAGRRRVREAKYAAASGLAAGLVAEARGNAWQYAAPVVRAGGQGAGHRAALGEKGEARAEALAADGYSPIIGDDRYGRGVRTATGWGGQAGDNRAALDRILAEALRPGGKAAGLLETAGRTLPGQPISLALVGDRQAAAVFGAAWRAGVDRAALVTTGKGAALVARRVTAWQGQGEAAHRATAATLTILAAGLVAEAEAAEALAATATARSREADAPGAADRKAAARSLTATAKGARQRAATAEAEALVARRVIGLGRFTLAALLEAATGTAIGTTGKARGVEYSSLDLRAVALVIGADWGTGKGAGATPAAIRLRAIVAEARTLAVAAAEAETTGLRNRAAAENDRRIAAWNARSTRRAALVESWWLAALTIRDRTEAEARHRTAATLPTGHQGRPFSPGQARLILGLTLAAAAGTCPAGLTLAVVARVRPLAAATAATRLPMTAHPVAVVAHPATAA
jgi:hypothetical protein